jgi:hypothetical protein
VVNLGAFKMKNFNPKRSRFVFLSAIMSLYFSYSDAQVLEISRRPPMENLGERLPGRPSYGRGMYSEFNPGESREHCVDQPYKDYKDVAECHSLGQGRNDATRQIWRCISGQACGDGNTFSTVRLHTRIENGKSITRSCVTFSNVHAYPTTMSVSLVPIIENKK